MGDRPKLTQTMTMHLNGGSKFSELHYKILADGEETGITRHIRTDGSPRYLKTIDALRCCPGGEEFDILATRGVGMVDWILARIPGGRDMPGRIEYDGSVNLDG